MQDAIDSAGSHEMKPLAKLCKTEFHQLDPEKQYRVRVCTVINGKSIARKVHVIKKAAAGAATAEEEAEKRSESQIISVSNNSSSLARYN